MTRIEWCDEVWNPVTGCTKVSAGCKNCYAERMAKRLGGRFGYPEVPNQFKVTLHPELLDKPLRWKRPRRVFVNSMSDLFHPFLFGEGLDDEIIRDYCPTFLDRAFAVMTIARQHTFLILTKRVDLMQWYMNDRNLAARIEPLVEEICGEHNWCPQDFDFPLPNVWAGASVENQEMANLRLPILVQIPAAKRFVSCEPLLGELDLAEWISPCAGNCDGNYPLDWVIIGGESGPGARPMDLAWAENIVIQCQDVGIPVFVKQLGGFPDKRNRMEEWPENLRIREWPE